jgi:LuxR family maltose regulon positive regulatory protein
VTGALLATKLHIPKVRRGLVARPRLLARMQDGADARLTLVSAPAGFGKTTVLAAWLQQAAAAGRQVAWLSLDASDNEPTSFWTYVVTALEAAAPSRDASALLELAGSTPVPTELLLTAMLNELVAAPEEVWLVLDDYHLVPAAEVGRGMAFLLEHLPPNVHIVLSTRADPDLPLARWRARGELVEIRAADLRFTSEETDAYLTEAVGHVLAADDVEVLEERTEGWIAALQLAAVSLRGRSDVSGFITRFAGDDRYIVDYLVEEVLAHLPDAVREFLLRSAVLDRLTGPLCDAVLGGEGGSEMILALERANLFIVGLDDRREWYRYHHLFADVLRARMLSEQPDQVSQLHQRASQWFQTHGLTEEAIAHALAARDFERAAQQMELAMTMIRRHRREAVMYGWLKALPEETVRGSPVLSLFYGSMLMAAGELDTVEPWLADAERALAAVPDGSALPWAETDDLRTLPSTIAIYRAALAQAGGDTAGTAVHARRAYDLAGPDDHLARGGAAGFLGFAAWATGDVPTALETFTQAVASLHAAGSLVDALSGTVVLADLRHAGGRPIQARRLCTQALGSAGAHGQRVARAAAELHVALSELDVELGDLRGARQHLDSAAALAAGAAMTESRYRWFVAEGLLTRAEGDPEGAVEFLNQAAQLYRPGFFPDVRPIPALTARIRITQGKLTQAVDWARERGVSVADEASYLHECDHLTLVRLLLAQHRDRPAAADLAPAARLLDRLHEAAEASGRAGSVLEIGLLQALLGDALGDRPQALECLAQAIVQVPEPEGYARIFLDEGPPMVDLLHAVELPGAGGDQIHRVLSLVALPTGPARAPGPGQAPPPVELLSERELDVLRLLDSQLTGPQIARELFVSHNTVRTHTKHIFTKLGVTNRRAAVLRAHEYGLL